MINLVGMVFWSFTFIFIICEFGENVCSAFDEINILFDEIDWYLFPIEIQRYLPTLFLVSQQPVLIQGYGNILFNRYAFKKVDSINYITTCTEHLILNV